MNALTIQDLRTDIAAIIDLHPEGEGAQNTACIYSKYVPDEDAWWWSGERLVPVCLVGQILDRHDMLTLLRADDDQLAEMSWNDTVAQGHEDDVWIEEEAWDWLAGVQLLADNMLPWIDCVRTVDAEGEYP